MTPVPEIDEAWPATPVPPKAQGRYALPPATIEIRLDGRLNGTRIVALQGESASFEITVEQDQIAVRLPQDDGSIRYVASIDPDGDLRVFHDRGIIEIFVGQGAVCGTRRSYVNISPDSLQIDTVARTKVRMR